MLNFYTIDSCYLAVSNARPKAQAGSPFGDPIPTPKARHREFREPGRSCGAEGMVRNFPAADILPESPKGRVLRWHARKRKRGPLSETPFPFDRSR